MSQLVVGLGQIGSAVQSILGCEGVDKELSEAKHYDVIHVAIPYNEAFDANMRQFIDLYTPDLIVVHSTVAPGTCEKFGAVHSPARGRHPNLEPGIRTFTKFFGGPRALEAAQLFADKGIDVFITEKSITTELGKLFDTEQYREAIVVQRQIKKLCDMYGADFDVVYTAFNKTYNEGYEALGEPQFKKYVLAHMEGPIGGHCVNPNHEILYNHGISIRPYSS
jgi:hypothetical protein